VAKGILAFASVWALIFSLQLLGIYIGAMLERQKAIDANVARWVLDPSTGESKFVYGVETEDRR